MNQVRKLQKQYLHSNTGYGTLPLVIPGGTRPKVGGTHDKIFKVVTSSFFVTVGFVCSRWRSTVTDGRVDRNTSHVIILLHSAHAQ